MIYKLTQCCNNQVTTLWNSCLFMCNKLTSDWLSYIKAAHPVLVIFDICFSHINSFLLVYSLYFFLSFSIALIQLATLDTVYILDVISLITLLSSDDWIHFFHQVFCNDNVIKLGKLTPFYFHSSIFNTNLT